MHKKTIIYIGGFELPDRNAAAQRVLSNGKIFNQLGYRVVFLGVDKELAQGASLGESKFNVSGFDAWRVPYPRSKKQWLIHISSIHALKELIHTEFENQVLAVICYNHPFIAQYKIRKLCRKINALFLADATEWYNSQSNSWLFSMVKALDVAMRMRYMHFKTDGLITTSKYLTAYYGKKGGKILELPTLYDLKQLRSLLPEGRINGDTVRLLYAGTPFNIQRLGAERRNIKDRIDKVIELLSQTYKYCQNFHVDIYGVTQQEYLLAFPDHESIVDHLSEQVTFHGKKEHKEILTATRNSDFTMYFRENERVILAGFPSKFSESISCGTPVITNKLLNIEHYIVENKNAVVIEPDQNSAAKKLSELFKNKSKLLPEMKQFCQDYQEFDFRYYVNITEKFMNKLVNE